MLKKNFKTQTFVYILKYIVIFPKLFNEKHKYQIALKSNVLV